MSDQPTDEGDQPEEWHVVQEQRYAPNDEMTRIEHELSGDQQARSDTHSEQQTDGDHQASSDDAN